MPKQSTPLALSLPPREAGAPAIRWLYAALRAVILDGRLRPGARLPSTRGLARRYGLSRGTIVGAFEQLRSEGYVVGRVGSGTYVTPVLPDSLLDAGRLVRTRSPAERGQPRRVSDYGQRVRPFPEPRVGPVRAFRTDLPALDLFPTTLWAQVAARRLRRASCWVAVRWGTGRSRRRWRDT